MGAFQMTPTSFGTIPSENYLIFPVQEPRKIYEKGGFSMRTGLTKKQKVTEVYYNAKDTGNSRSIQDSLWCNVCLLHV